MEKKKLQILSRANKAELDRRYQFIMTLIEQGWSEENDIIQEIRRRKKWTVCDRQIRSYIQHCFQMLQKRAHEDVDRIFGTLWLRHESIFRAAQKEHVYTAMMDALKEMAKLAGCYRPSKFALTDPTGRKDYGERIANISFIESALRASPEIQEQLVELLAKLGEQRNDDQPGPD
ncbi:MAG TPA: hypothetical protein PKZ83_16805 [bacterium]|nr:hypothetical protein [bacterium]HQJ66292.1 hypothetical protein [bacterium]